MLRRNKHSGDGHMLDIFARGTIHIEDLEVGMRRGLSKIVSDRDMELFGEVTTDRNPVHFDDDYAGRSMFGGRIVHGMLTASLISAVIGERLPGHGTNFHTNIQYYQYDSLYLVFHIPLFIHL